MRYLLFLDIDGVLNTEEHLRVVSPTWTKDGIHKLLRQENIGALNQLFDGLPATTKYIVHSHWSRRFDIKEINGALKKAGFRYTRRSSGTTPKKLSSAKIHEVSWALDNIKTDVFYILIDDESGFEYLEQRVEQKGIFFKIDPKVGLDQAMVELIIQSLPPLK